MFFYFYRQKQKILEKYTKLWDKTKNQIKTINGDESIKYEKDFLKIRFESNDGLPLGKILSIPVMVITGSVFEDGKYYPQFFLHECVYQL